MHVPHWENSKATTVQNAKLGHYRKNWGVPKASYQCIQYIDSLLILTNINSHSLHADLHQDIRIIQHTHTCLRLSNYFNIEKPSYIIYFRHTLNCVKVRTWTIESQANDMEKTSVQFQWTLVLIKWCVIINPFQLADTTLKALHIGGTK